MSSSEPPASESSSVPLDREEIKRKRKEKKKQQRAQGFKKLNVSKRTWVYFNGLGEGVTEGEVIAFFSKCGIVKKDEYTGEYKLKIYMEGDRRKGDGSIAYLRRESVSLAELILDGTEIKPGMPLEVKEAKFEMKKSDEPHRKRRKRKGPKLNQQKELGWEEWETRQDVILKHMFTQDEAKEGDGFFDDLQADIKGELEKLGPIETFHIFKYNPDGVIAVKFSSPEHAQSCVESMNGRWFAKRQIEAVWYDGITNYHVDPPEDVKKAEENRLSDFASWLDDQSSSSDDGERVS